MNPEFFPRHVPSDDGVLPLLIDGRWVAAQTGLTVGNMDPATEMPLPSPAAAGRFDVDAAVLAALRASHDWGAAAPEERRDRLLALAAALEVESESFAHIDARDGGLPLRVARADVSKGISLLRYFARLATELQGRTFPQDQSRFVYTLRQPYGVVAVITPFNHPAMFAISKVAAPLAAGNAVVLKPPEQASLSSIALAAFARDLLPPGVLNIVTGTGVGAGAPLVNHPDVSRIAFTGSVLAGKAVLQAAAERVVPCSLELGGKNASIVYPDAPLDSAVAGVIQGMSLGVCGQSCQSGTRLFLHRSIHDDFLAQLAVRLKHVRIGMPLSETTDMGPLVSEQQLERVSAYIQGAVDDGARLVAGGNRPQDAPAHGFFLEPTVFADVRTSMRIAREEVFGPVLSVIPWDDEGAMLESVNELPLGLTASVWTTKLDAIGIARKLDVGYVYINKHGGSLVGVPFGGWKESGMGVEHSFDALLAFTRSKTVEAVIAHE